SALADRLVEAQPPQVPGQAGRQVAVARRGRVGAVALDVPGRVADAGERVAGDPPPADRVDERDAELPREIPQRVPHLDRALRRRPRPPDRPHQHDVRARPALPGALQQHVRGGADLLCGNAEVVVAAGHDQHVGRGAPPELALEQPEERVAALHDEPGARPPAHDDLPAEQPRRRGRVRDLRRDAPLPDGVAVAEEHHHRRGVAAGLRRALPALPRAVRHRGTVHRTPERRAAGRGQGRHQAEAQHESRRAASGAARCHRDHLSSRATGARGCTRILLIRNGCGAGSAIARPSSSAPGGRAGRTRWGNRDLASIRRSPPGPDGATSPRDGAAVTPRERLSELDLLRFLAALAVVLYHFTGFGGAGAWPEPAGDVFPEVAALTRFGYLGVDLFFVISGFVILMSAWGRGPGEFGISRLVRLMPAYWASVLLGLLVYGLFRQGHGVPGLVVPNLTMLQGGL